MEYCGVTIKVEKRQAFYEVPIRKPGNADSDFVSLTRGPGKQALSTSVSLNVFIAGYEVVDHAFLYELRAILEEFINKRLGERKPGRSINAVIEPFGIDYGAISIERVEAQLVFKLVDHDMTTSLVALDAVRAKALHAILNKALQYADFQ